MKARRSLSLWDLTRLDAFLSAACFAVGLGLYVRTLAPGLLTDDSAEFQTLAYTLGMTHPTGYPLYLLLAKLFTFIVPIKDIAYRVNLLSAVFAALTLALLYLVGRLLSGWRLAPLAGALALGTQPLFWSQSVIAELYAPAACFITAVLLLVLLWRKSGKVHFIFTAGLLGGLSLAVHSTVALMAPAIIIYMLLVERRRSTWTASLGGVVLGVLVSLSAFLVVDKINAPSSYFNSVVRPSLSTWGLSAAQFDSPFERLAFLYAARQFRIFMFSKAGTISVNVSLYVSFFDWITAVFLVIGLFRLFLLRWREALLVVMTWVCQMVFVLNYAIWDIYVFFIPTFVALAVVLISGMAALQDGTAWLARWIFRARQTNVIAHTATGLLVITLFIPAMPFIASSISAGHPTFADDRVPVHPEGRNNALLLARAVANELEDDAIVFTDWDMLYAYYYAAHVEQQRTTMSFHETFPQDGVTNLASSARDYITDNLTSHSVYATDRYPELMRYFKLIRLKSGLNLYRIEPQP
jgi:hypothetical protein